MTRITIETALANSDYGGVVQCSEQTQAASGMELVVDMLNDMLRECGSTPLTDEERANIKVIGCEFIEADSSKMHGSCYFNVELEVPASLKERLED